MNTKTTIALAITMLGLGTVGGWIMGRQGTDHAAPTASTQADKPVLYWYDPMKPDVHFDKPGKSPFMDMQLIPRHADEPGAGEASSGVRIDPALTQNTGVKLATVERGELADGLDVAGSVVFNEREVAIVQARTGGIVEHAYPLAVGDVIKAGSPLADVRVPEWLVAQNEYLALRSDAQLGAAAKSRLIQLGMSPASVDALERSGRAQPVITIAASRSGVISELDVRQGMTLSPGQTLARINGLASVWIEANVPEAQAAQVRAGMPVAAHFAAWPNQPVMGKVTSLVPELKADTRTIRVRIEVPNKNGQLQPGLYARVSLSGNQATHALLVPSDAIIATGKRNVVIAVDGADRFQPVEVQIGREQAGKTAITAGLQEGQRVVVSGQFMIDSEASLRGVLARMSSSPASGPSAAAGAVTKDAARVVGIGVVKAIEAGSITLAHEPIAALKWPAMTMPFTLMSPGAAKGIAVGDQVRFTLMMHGDEAMIESMTRVDGGGQ